MRERFFNNQKFRSDKLNYKFFVIILAVMMFSVTLPTMLAFAQIPSGVQTSIMSPSDLALSTFDAENILQTCIKQFQGADHIYCDNIYGTEIAKSGQLGTSGSPGANFR